VKQLAPAVVLSHGPGGLGTVRTLARRGVDVTALLLEVSDTSRYSRYASKVVDVAAGDNAQRDGRMLSVLNELDRESAAILTTSDVGVSFLSRNRDELARKYRFTLPEADLIDALNDKSREVALIESIGYALPRTITKLPADYRALISRLRLPIIFKPHSFAECDLFPKKNEVVVDLAEMERFYEEWSHALHGLLAQEVIPGPISNSWVCSCTYDESSKLLDCMTRQKFRTIPPEFGTSTYSICRNNEAVVELARDLGPGLRYVGHAGIEFRWDDRDGEYKYIELNPRIPGEVGFDAACGLPTVWNSYLVALGESAGCSGEEQRQGLVFHDMHRDILTLRGSRVAIPKILGIQLAMLFRRRSGLYFAFDDIKPGAVVALRFLGELWGAGRRTLARKFRKPASQRDANIA
jgi:predicted ATP-grasp superfamily ATP-dependent carboligase